MATLIMPNPSEKQKLFLTDEHKFIAFGGSRGGGKSFAVRMKAVLLCINYPGIKVMIIRKTYPELTENHIMPLVSLLNCYANNKADRVATYNDSKKTMTFPNGSRLLFRYCDSDKDAERFQGTEVDVLFLDEATHQTEDKMKKLTACVRGVNDFPKRIYMTANPGSVGHGWFKRLFIDKRYENGENPEDYTFIQSLVTDNVALMKENPDYIKQLEALPPKLRKMWLEGDWSIAEGQYFEDFRPDPDINKAVELGIEPEELRKQHRWCHVIEPFDLNVGECRGWTIMRSYDFGYGKPFSLGYWACDYDGTLYRILEFYGCTSTPNEGVKWSPDEQFRRISEFEHQHPWLKGRDIVDSVADPAIWDASRGESIAETAMKYGIYFSPGDNARIPGWMQVHYRLQFDDNGYSRMYIFNNCKHFIRTIPLMMYSETHPEDIDTTLEDHIADETRYMCMSRPIMPIIPKENKVIISDPLNMFTDYGR